MIKAVAGEPAPDPRDAEITTLREKLAQAEQATALCQRENWRLLQEVGAQRNDALKRAEQAEQRVAQAEAATWRAAVRMVRERLHYGEGEMCGCDGCMRLSVLADQMEARALAPASPQESRLSTKASTS